MMPTPKHFTLPEEMTSISLTSGQILDIISLLEEREDALYDAEEKGLAVYYMQMGVQFQRIYDRLQDVQPEKRVANLVLAS
jgi:hypothetical protein